MVDDNLFLTYMEAGEEDMLPSFDVDDTSSEENISMDNSEPNTEPASADTSQPMGDFIDQPPSGDDDISMDDGSSDSGDSDNPEGEQTDGDKASISTKISDNLNSELLSTFSEKNNFISKTIEDLRRLTPLLPPDIVQKVSENIKTLNLSLGKGKDYIITFFDKKEYGENLMYYEKLNTLYELLLKDINSDIKDVLKK